jgi:poly(3-hydroxyalkanoate) synthetase
VRPGEFTVITVDIRGFGESDKSVDPEDYAIENLTDDLIRVADGCGVDSFGLWGYSLGGNIGRYLSAWSSKVWALSVIGIPWGLAVSGPFKDNVNKYIEEWSPLVSEYKIGNITDDIDGEKLESLKKGEAQ